MLTQQIVVGRIDRLADIVDMGRGLCLRNVASRDMEFYQRAALFREAHAITAAANHGYDVECRRRFVLAHQTKTRTSVQLVPYFVGTLGGAIHHNAMECFISTTYFHQVCVFSRQAACI